MTFFRKYQILTAAIFALFFASPLFSQARKPMPVGSISIKIDGPQYISADAVMAHVKLREGDEQAGIIN